MSWQQDPFWVAASQSALEAADQAELVLVPAEFLGLHPRFAPLEYSWGFAPEERRIAWCCTKDDAHRFAPWVHEGYADKRWCAWSNEVFVLCGRFEWARKATAGSIRHWQAWRERVAVHLAGRDGRESPLRPAPGALSGRGPRVLVVGASGMGNVGDDLLASVLAEQLRRHAGARVWWSNSDVDLRQLKTFDAAVVGGGGLVYASRDGRNETQNLANYLKFGPMCRVAGVPVAFIGVSDQDHAGGLDRDPIAQAFARACLPMFMASTTRDDDSTALLQRLGVPDVRTGPDLLFGWAAKARRVLQAAQLQPARLALAGELLDNTFVAQAVRDSTSPLARALAQQEVDLLLMSNDDVPHAHRMRTLLSQLGASPSIQDLRGRSFEALVHAFAQYRTLITTRFHGLVMALICQVPVVALDGPSGKKARLLRQLRRDDEHLLVSGAASLDEGISRLAVAVSGGLRAVPPMSLRPLAKGMLVHTEAMRALLARWIEADDLADAEDDAVEEGVAPLPPGPGVALRFRDADLARPGADAGDDIALCWAASTRETQGFGNLGDSLSAVMVSALSGRKVLHTNFDRPETKLVAVGSIAHAIRGGEAVVWGSGVSIRGGVLVQNVPQTRYDVRAIRGLISAKHFRDLGIPVPEVYGDPVWLLPSIFDEPVPKRFELGVIPHIQDIDGFGPSARPPADSLRFGIDPGDSGAVTLINTWHTPDWEGLLANLRLILSCKRIVSQSFHGVVIAEAYGIPVLNFRQLPGVANGGSTISLEEDCATDPRIWEFFRGGKRPSFEMYVQRRDQRTDWDDVIKAIDSRWQPFSYDATALVESFPLPLAYDPLAGRVQDFSKLRSLRF